MTKLTQFLPVFLPLFFLTACESLISNKQLHSNNASANQEKSTPDEQSEQIGQPVVFEDIWSRVRSGYALPDSDNSRIDQYLHTYTSRQKNIDSFTERSAPYIHYVVSELEANDMPLELAFLPILESSYNPFAYSSRNAAGIWQFMPKTGKSFGLEQNSWYDGRRDIVASTDAAIRYLQQLYTMFDDDWLLALAAYNAGQGTLRRAIRKNQKAGKPTDFWSLPLPKQTQAYVPRLLALSRIFAEPENYELTLESIPNDPYFTPIDIDEQINLAQVAQLADIDIKELQQLNAGYSRWLTDPSRTHQILVPIADASVFLEQLETLPKQPPVTWKEYKVKRGDNLGSIARQFDTSVATLKTNNQLKNDFLRIGQVLQISSLATLPGYGELPSADELMRNYRNGNNANRRYHTVRSGDSLWKIARQHKTTVNTLARLNNISRNSTLKLGQKLLINSRT